MFIYIYILIIYTTFWCHCLWDLHNRITDSIVLSQTRWLRECGIYVFNVLSNINDNNNKLLVKELLLFPV